MVGGLAWSAETDFVRHQRASLRLKDVQGEIDAYVERLTKASVNEEEPFSLPRYAEFEALLDKRALVIADLHAAESEIRRRIGLAGDPEEVGSIDDASIEQTGGAEPAEQL